MFDASILYEDLDLCVSELQKLGADADKPNFEVVDKFAPPFDKFKWSAFCPDSEDEKRYNIPKGIYFRADSFRPFYTKVLLSHEIIHTISGKRDPDLLAMGLEEGIAEILGSVFLGSKLVGSKTANNIFIYSRHSNPISSIWKLYLDHTRQASIIYRRFGLKGLIYLINNGRKAIHDTEKLILTNQFSKIDLPCGDYDEQLNDNIEYLVNGYLPNFNLSPLMFYLLQFIEEGMKVKDICDQATVPYEIGKKEIEDLSSETTLYMIDNEIIQYSNVNFYRSLEAHGASIFKYKL